MSFKFDLGKSEFLKHSLTIFTGASLGQVITLSVSLVLARFYTPAEFGDWSLFMAIVAILSVVSTARYEMAIMLPEKQRDAINILALSILIAGATSIVVMLVILIAGSFFTGFFDDSSSAIYWLYLVPVAVFIKGSHQAFNYWSTRNKQYPRNAMGRVSNSATAAIVNVGLGHWRFGPWGVIEFGTWGTLRFGAWGLVLGQVLGLLVDLLVLVKGSVVSPGEMYRQLSWATMKENLKKYSNFAKINSPHALVDNIKEHGIVFLITYFFAATILGHYSFILRILKAPVGLIGSSIYQVFYQRAATGYAKNEDIQSLIWQIYKKNILIALPLFGVLFFVVEDLFVLVYGESWRVAGEIGQILMPWLFFQFMASPVSSISIIANKQTEAMYFTIADLFLRAGALILGAHYGNYKLSFMLISGSGSVLLIYALYWYYKIAGNNLKKAY